MRTTVASISLGLVVACGTGISLARAPEPSPTPIAQLAQGAARLPTSGHRPWPPALIDLEALPDRRAADRSALLDVLGRSPTAVFEVSEARCWLVPLVRAIGEPLPLDSAFRSDLEELVARLEVDGSGPLLLAFDNRTANATLILSTPRPHTLALQLGEAFDLAPMADRSSLYAAQEVAMVSLHRPLALPFTQPMARDALATLVTDSRRGLMVATTSHGEANRANSHLTSSQMSPVEPPRINERLRSVLDQPPPDALAVQGALDLSRALRSLEPQVALWVRRTLGLPGREGVLAMSAQENDDGMAWQMAPVIPSPAAPSATDEVVVAQAPGRDSGLLPFFLELPREGANVAVALERAEAGLLLASYRDLLPSTDVRDLAAGQPDWERRLVDATGVSFSTTVEPLLGRRIGYVGYAPAAGGPDGATDDGTQLLVFETRDELTLDRLAARLLAGPSSAPDAVPAAWSLLAPAWMDRSQVAWRTRRERLAIAWGPEALQRLDAWQHAQPAIDPGIGSSSLQHLGTERASCFGWALSMPPQDNAALVVNPLPWWWTMEHRPTGLLEIRGLVQASRMDLARAVVANVPVLQTANPGVQERLDLVEHRMAAIEVALRRYLQDHRLASRALSHLDAWEGFDPVIDTIDPFTDPPQPLGYRLMGETRWMLTSVGPDRLADPDELTYNPRCGILSRGDIHRIGGLWDGQPVPISEVPMPP